MTEKSKDGVNFQITNDLRLRNVKTNIVRVTAPQEHARH